MTRFELRFGTPVVRKDREYGALDGIVLADQQPVWEALIIRQGLLHRSPRLLDREAVQDATDTAITAVAPPRPISRPAAGRLIRARTPVRTPHGQQVGHLELLLAGSDGRISHLVVRRRPLGPRQMIPLSALVAIGPDGVLVDLPPRAVRALPPYHDDADLQSSARLAIETLPVAAGYDARFVHTRVRDGMAELTGHVSSRMRAEQIEAAIAGLPVLLGVDNRLVGDDQLAIVVAEALDAEPRTRGCRIHPAVHHGVVTLLGNTSDDESAAATAVVAGIPSVRGIVNQIRAPGILADAAWSEPPLTGAEVIAEDTGVGIVEQVLIDPQRRRFAGVVVDARVPIADAPDAPLVERLVLIPAGQIRDVTELDVLISGRALDAARGPLAASATIPAPPGWQPPFPYHRGDVVWPAERSAPYPQPGAEPRIADMAGGIIIDRVAPAGAAQQTEESEMADMHEFFTKQHEQLTRIETSLVKARTELEESRTEALTSLKQRRDRATAAREARQQKFTDAVDRMKGRIEERKQETEAAVEGWKQKREIRKLEGRAQAAEEYAAAAMDVVTIAQEEATAASLEAIEARRVAEAAKGEAGVSA